MNRKLNRRLRACWWGGAAPLLVGLVILLMIWLFDWSWLYTAGLLTLLVMGVSLFVGAIVASICVVHTLRRRTRPPGTALWPLARLLCWYVLFGITAASAVGVAEICSRRYELIVRNATEEPMMDVRATCTSRDVGFGQIAPGQTKRQVFWFPGRGALRIHGIHAGRNFAAVVDGCASCNGWRETTHVTLDSNGVLRSANRFDEFTQEKEVPIHPPTAPEPPG